MKTYTEEEVTKLCDEAEKRGVLSAHDVIVKTRWPGWKRFSTLIKDFADSLD
jgi:hypothetical protein